mmetsp:Transcript_18897/g.26313  ORF Transcript_18897/g.26313 Transcript_18897/m.26313 type:complete len:340 (-) Transcript_18897:228-1247(-)
MRLSRSFVIIALLQCVALLAVELPNDAAPESMTLKPLDKFSQGVLPAYVDTELQADPSLEDESFKADKVDVTIQEPNSDVDTTAMAASDPVHGSVPSLNLNGAAEQIETPSIDDVEFWAAFGTTVSMIIATELGDKTFFIAAILAMKHNRLMVFLGAVSALALMTVLSVAVGYALPNLFPKLYTYYAAIILFAYFGIKLLYDAFEMYVNPPKSNEELEEVENELSGEADVEALAKKPNEVIKSNPFAVVVPAIFSQAFALTFIAEWGDRSQIATIALAAGKDPFGVTAGGIFGHACCTGLAVLGGRLIAKTISERQVALFGGLLFLGFAGFEAYAGPPS